MRLLAGVAALWVATAASAACAAMPDAGLVDVDFRIDPPAALAEPIDRADAGGTDMTHADMAHADGAGAFQLPPPYVGPTRPDAMADDGATRRYAGFGRKVGAVKWEVGALAAYMTVTQILVTKETEPFHFQDEGWFGKSTTNLGVDKLTHAYNGYLLAELFNARIARKTGDSSGAWTAAALSLALMTYSELYDAHKVSSGFSVQDMISNTAGAAFSVARNTVPGLKEKLDFRLLLIPNGDIYTFKGKRHYAQQRFMLALQLAGFDRLKDTPWRFAELHVGYHASNFTNRDRDLGREPRRRIFYGVGVNLKELFWPTPPRSTLGRIGRTALDYLQVPYTAVHVE